MDYRLRLEKILTDIENDIESVNEILKMSTNGRVIETKNCGKKVIMSVTGHGKERKRHIITDDIDMQVDLARNEIYKDRLMELTRLRGIIMNALVKTSLVPVSNDAKNIKERFSWFSDSGISRALKGNSYNDSRENEKYCKSDYYSDRRRIITSRGLFVRSKSELLIAEALYRYNIPFHYEEVIYVSDSLQLIPDFTIMWSDGSIILWEHEGLISSETYINWQRKKFEIFASKGFYPWKNLIVTYDTEDGAIDARIIESEIKIKILNDPLN